MIKIAVIFADGTEEIEALTPVDVLKRAGAVADVISVSGVQPTGSHGIKIVADKISVDADFSLYDGIVIPGGMPGAINISNDKKVLSAIKDMADSGKLVASICASPAVVLGGNNLLSCDSATCYPAPDFIKVLGDKYTGENVTVNNNFITANGPKSAMEFSLAICKFLGINPKF